MPASAVDLARQLDGETLPGVILVFGEEPLLIEESGDRVRNRALALGYEERLVLHVDPKFNWGRLTETAQSLSLFSQRRLIDLRLPTGRPGDAGSQAIVQFCTALPDDTALLISSGRLDGRIKQGKWYKAIDRAGLAVEHKAVTAAQLPGWIKSRARAQGLTIEQDAVALLAHFTEGNLLAAAQEIDKLRFLPETGRTIGYEDVSESIADSARFTVYTLVNHCLAGHPKRALRTLRGLRQEGVEPILIVWALANQVRTLYRVSVGLAQGQPKAQLFKSLRVWYKQESLVSSALGRHRLLGWSSLLEDMAALDRLVKGRSSGDVWETLERACLSICGLEVGTQAR